jgi:hypothetical protein
MKNISLYLNRWVQPDDIIRDPYNPLDWDHYQYAQGDRTGSATPR